MSYAMMKLGSGRVDGINLGEYGGWVGGRTIPATWLDEGHEGVEILGDLDRSTVMSVGYNAACYMGSKAMSGVVRFHRVTFEMGAQCCLFVGQDSYAADVCLPGRVELFDCNLSDNGHPVAGKVGVTGIYGYQNDISVIGGNWWLANSGQHGYYAHGFGEVGAYFENLTIHKVPGEGLKFRNPPHRVLYTDDAWIEGQGGEGIFAMDGPYNSAPTGVHPVRRPNGERPLVTVKNCLIKNWGQPSSHVLPGSGLVGQGTGADFTITDTRFIGGEDDTSSREGLGVAFDNGAREGAHYGEFFDENDRTAPHVSRIGNGAVVLDRVLIYVPGMPDAEWSKPIARFLDCESVIVRNSGIFSSAPGGYIGLGHNSSVVFENCNTPAIKNMARLLGVPNEALNQDVRLNDQTGPGGWLEAGYHAAL